MRLTYLGNYPKDVPDGVLLLPFNFGTPHRQLFVHPMEAEYESLSGSILLEPVSPSREVKDPLTSIPKPMFWQLATAASCSLSPPRCFAEMHVTALDPAIM